MDDVAFKITHVVRAAEHLTNTAVQAVAYRAHWAPLPTFAHVPVVNEPNSKKKLSKRDMKKFVTAEVRAKLNAIGWTDEEIDSRDDLNPATVAFYREMGYLPAALVNYLGRLGWSLDDKTEIMPLETMIANFSLERVNDSPASFDPEKLHWMAGEYMKQLPLDAASRGRDPVLAACEVDPRSPRRRNTRQGRRRSSRRAATGSRSSRTFFKSPPSSSAIRITIAALVEKRLKKEGMPALVAPVFGNRRDGTV